MNKKEKKLIWIPLFGALFLAGCVSVPHLETQSIEKLDNLQTGKINYSLKENFEFKSNHWWEAFHDENLNNLMSIVLKNNKDVAIAKLNLEKSDEQIKLAKANKHVSADLNGSFEAQHIDLLSHPSAQFQSIDNSYANIGQLGLSASYNFDLFNKYSSLINEQKTQKAGLQLKEQYTELSLSTQTLKLYIYYQFLIEEKENLLKQKTNLTELKNLELANIKIGKDIPEKSINFNEALRVNENDLQINQENEQITLSSLSQLANAHTQDDRDKLSTYLSNHVDKIILSNEMFVPQQINSDTIKNRPDVAYYLTTIEAQKDELKSLKADFYPSFSIKGTASLEYINLQDFLSATALMQSITPSFTLPILDSGRITSNYKIAGVDLKIFTQQYNQALLNAYYDVNQNLIKEKTQKSSLEIQSRTLKDDKVLLDNITIRKQIGKASLLDYQNQYNNYLKSELNYKKQAFNFATSQVELINSLGGMYQ